MELHPNVPTVDVPQLSPERRLLWEAANYMENHGQDQMKFECRDTGRVCIKGAIRRAMGFGIGDGTVWDMPEYQAVEKLVAARVPYGHINAFNMDHDQATVIETLRMAALS